MFKLAFGSIRLVLIPLILLTLFSNISCAVLSEDEDDDAGTDIDIASLESQCRPVEHYINPRYIEIRAEDVHDLGLFAGPESAPPDCSMFGERNRTQYVDLGQVSVSAISLLNPNQLSDLVTFLSRKRVSFGWVDASGKIPSGSKLVPGFVKRCAGICLMDKKMNAATALAIILSRSTDTQRDTLIGRVISIAPLEILKDLQGDRRGILTKDIVGSALLSILYPVPTFVQDDRRRITSVTSSAKIVEVYLQYWAGKDKSKIRQYTKGLIDYVDSINREAISATQYGLLLGSVFSGAIKYTHDIRDADGSNIVKILFSSEFVIQILGTLTNFLQVYTPDKASSVVAALVPGGVSLVLLILGNIYANGGDRPRDYLGIVKRIQGGVESKILTTREANEILDRIRVSLHICGHRD